MGLACKQTSWLLLPGLVAGEPSGELKSAIEKDFGSFDEFKKQFSTAGATQFGSGWAWLVKDGGKLKVGTRCDVTFTAYGVTFTLVL